MRKVISIVFWSTLLVVFGSLTAASIKAHRSGWIYHSVTGGETWVYVGDPDKDGYVHYCAVLKPGQLFLYRASMQSEIWDDEVHPPGTFFHNPSAAFDESFVRSSFPNHSDLTIPTIAVVIGMAATTALIALRLIFAIRGPGNTKGFPVIQQERHA
jgi:hypothetical protein